MYLKAYISLEQSHWNNFIMVQLYSSPSSHLNWHWLAPYIRQRQWILHIIRSPVPMLDSDWLRHEWYKLYLSLQHTKSVSVKQLDRYFLYMYSSDVISRDLPDTPLPQSHFHFKTCQQTGVSSACPCLSTSVKIKRFVHFLDEQIALNRTTVMPNNTKRGRLY